MNYRLFLTLFIPFLILISLGFYQAFQKEKEYQLNKIIITNQDELKTSGALFEKEISNTVEDLRFLRTTLQYSAALSNNSTESWQRLAELFQNLAQQKQDYHQIRFIDKTGQERLRVHNHNDKSIIVDAGALQNKSHRYYFIEAMRLEDKEFYFSAFDLNIENGEVEIPFRPMLRIATPVFDRAGHQKMGIVIINYNGQAAIDLWLKNISSKEYGSLSLLNSRGDWLHGGAGANWAFVFGNEIRYSDQFPDIWSQIKGQKSGVVPIDDGAVIFKHIFFDPEDQDFESNKQLISIYRLDGSGLKQLTERFTNQLIAIYLILIGFGFVLIYLLAEYLSNQEKRRLQEKEADLGHLLSKSQRIGNVGTWTYNYDRQTFYLDEFLQKKYKFDYADVRLAEIHGRLTQKDAEFAKEILSRALNGESFGSWVHSHKVNQERILWIKSSWEVEKDKNGNVIGLIGMDKDITEDVITRQKEKELSQSLMLATEVGKLGTFSHNWNTGEMLYTDMFAEIYGLNPHDNNTPEIFFATIHKNDSERMHERIDEAKTTQKPVVVQYRIITPSGELRHLQASFLFNSETQIMVGSVQDITEQLMAVEKEHILNERLFKEREFLNATQKVAQIGSFRTNMQTNAMWFSDHFKSIFGYTLNDDFDIPTWLKHIHPEDVKKVEEITKQIFENQNFIKTKLSYRIIDNDHKIKHVEVVWDYQVDEKGQPTFMEGMVRDITDQIRAEQQAKEHEAALNIDPLTHVYNRRFFDEILGKTCKHTQRNGGRMAIAMIDIDFFKVYNDSNGHNKGDIVLKKVAQELNNQLRRDEDYFFRVGGEEFAAIFSAKDFETMQEMADSLVESVRKLALPFPQSQVSDVDYVTISLGALYTDCLDFSSIEALYEEADKLLYKAKEKGRNQAVTSHMCSS